MTREDETAITTDMRADARGSTKITGRFVAIGDGADHMGHSPRGVVPTAGYGVIIRRDGIGRL